MTGWLQTHREKMVDACFGGRQAQGRVESGAGEHPHRPTRNSLPLLGVVQEIRG